MSTHNIVRRYAAPMIITCALAGVPAAAVAQSVDRSADSYPHTAREAQNPVSAPKREDTRSDSARGTGSGELNPHTRREAQNPVSAPRGEADRGAMAGQRGVTSGNVSPQSDRERQNPARAGNTPTMGLGADEDERRTRQRPQN